MEFTASRPLGGAYVLNGLWDRLGLAKTLRGLLGTTRRDPVTERVLFALVANRALAPASKLAATSWVNHDVHLPGLVEVSDDACYRAMDWLLSVEPTLAKDVYHQVADLLNLEVDLLFFDTTSTYFVTEQADEPVWRDRSGRLVPAPEAGADGTADGDEVAAPPEGAVKQAGFRTWGKSKDHRDDLPQVVVGMAVTRDGIPVRCWCWPGNTSDSALIRQVKDDLRDWSLARVVWVADRGSPRRRTAATCNAAPAATSWARSSAPAPLKPTPPSPGQAATRKLPGTCASRKSRSASMSGSWCATTPKPPNVTPPSAPTWWSTCKG